MRAIVEGKRRGREHAPGEIEALVAAFARDEIDDAVMAAWLMAVCFAGMTLDETARLTRAMAESGETIDWSGEMGPIVDKHSTGGVGDVVTLVAVPLAAARGAKIAKLSGRALGHTGGTIDKLECIPGMRVDLRVPALKAQVKRVGCAIASASAALAPADKKMYALRDRTATVASIPLIAASILAKKVAGGASTIVIDVKVGSGAFMRTLDEARTLAETLVAVGARLDRRVRALLTDMEEPLADSVGDALELDEALRSLEGAGSARVRHVASAVAGDMLELAGMDARDIARALDDGSALCAFESLVAAQGGKLASFERRFAPTSSIAAPGDGYVQRVDALAIGESVAGAKAARPREARTVGVRLRARSGDLVRRGQALLDCYGSSFDAAALQAAFTIGDDEPPARPLILGAVE